MTYINQCDKTYIPYDTNVLHGGRPPQSKTLKSGGCGICSTCMMVDYLTDKTLSLEECIQLSYDSLANHSPGTDLDMLGPAVAEKYGLNYKGSNSLDELKKTLQSGGAAIVHVQKGLFTTSGHYMLLLSYDGEDICFLDPGGFQKYVKPENEGKVNIAHYPYLYYNAELMHAETNDRATKYHLFTRKK